MIKDVKFHNVLKYGLYILFTGILLFSRSFVGISILGFRIGEILIALSVIFSLFLLLTPRKKFIKFTNLSVSFFYTHKLIILCFFLSLLINQHLPNSAYFFKSSSFIWVLIYFYVGLFISKKNIFNINAAYFFWLILILQYFLATTIGTFPHIGYYPEPLNEFFINYSDKVEPIKASNLIVVLIFVNHLIYVNMKNIKILLFGYLFNVALIFPLLAFNSRGSVLFCAIYAFHSIYYLRSYIFENKLFTAFSLLFCGLVFFTSTVWIFGEFNIQTREGVAEISQEVATSTQTAIQRKNYNPETFMSFYFLDGRIYSLDGTTDWRLDIWQDSIDYQLENKQFLFGVGYDNLLVIMNDPEEPGRYGYDGLNEHVHNYVITILARGGLLLLIATGAFWILMLYNYRKIKGSYYILLLIIPPFLNALIDVAMESVQFPLVYLTLLGLSFKNQNKE